MQCFAVQKRSHRIPIRFHPVRAIGKQKRESDNRREWLFRAVSRNFHRRHFLSSEYRRVFLPKDKIFAFSKQMIRFIFHDIYVM